MDISQKTEILRHFKLRLYQRYNITGISQEMLQNEFRKRVSLSGREKYKTKLLQAYDDRFKCLYISTFQNKRVKFIFNHKLNLAKTVIK